MLALTKQLRGDLSAALSALERALDLAETEGYVRVFVDEGPRMGKLLQELGRRGIAASYVRRLLEAMGEVEDRARVNPLLAQPLSERELGVLRLLRTDLDGPDIARELVVSLSPVRGYPRAFTASSG